MMLIALWLFAPGILAALYFNRLLKRTLSPVYFISAAVSFSFVIALFLLGIFYLRGYGDHEWTMLFSPIARLVKYAALSLLGAVIFPNLALLLVKLTAGKQHDEQGK